MQKVAILGGLGIEGKALQKYLEKTRPDLKPVILDQKTDPDYLSRLEEFDLVYRTPGVLPTLPEIKKAIRKGVRFSSSINLFFEKAKGIIVGVTGTKGKGTTAQLIYEILKNAGKDAYIGGNIGNSPLEFVDKLTDRSITVLELSNLQLWDIKHSPHIAAVLGIFPEHLDWHKNYREYVSSKIGITKYQTKKDIVFYIGGDKNSKKIASKSKGQKVAVSAESFAARPGVLGYHNFKNAAMAAAVCSHLGVRPDIILEAISRFKGLPHRLQKVHEIKGVDYYNDSASTAPETAVAAIEAFPERHVILIAGGKDKNSDYSILRKGIEGKDVKLAILFGVSKEKIKNAIGSTAQTKIVKDLKEAVEIAYKKAKEGDIVLFSPGATSLDMFENYKDRGEQFNEIVKKLKD